MSMNSTFGLHCYGVGWTSKVQEYFTNYESNLLFFSHLGDPRYAFLALFPLAYCLDNYLGLKVLWLSALTEWVNAILKWIARDDRPYWWQSHDCPFSGRHLKQFSITCESGPGFPSGHVMSSSSLGLLLIIYLSKLMNTKTSKTIILTILVPIYASLIILVSLSRVFIATHFPHQVVVGAMVGMVMTVSVHTITSRYSTTILLNKKSVIGAAVLLCIALLLFYILTIFKLNPLSSVDLALSHCQKREWVHVDTTLFFAIVRDVGSFCGISVSALLFEVFRAREREGRQLVSIGDKSRVQRIAGLLLAIFFCVLFSFTEGFKLPQENMTVFYFLATWKYTFIVSFVIVTEYIFRISLVRMGGGKDKKE